MSFKRLHELIELANDKSMSIGQLMLETECKQSGLTESQILNAMSQQFDVMEEAARKGVETPIQSRTGLTGGDAYRVQQYLESGNSFLTGPAIHAMSYALSVNEVNAGMGRIVATPTAGSAGVLPGVLVSILDTGQYSRDTIVFSMLTAAALGLVIANSASISGAAGGCQAEIGSATAMAAGAAVEIRGGTPEQAGHAVGLALKNSMGLVCDPVGGLVEIPCIIRNGLHAVTALATADMALAGVRSLIPPDEVIQAMYDIGNELPSTLRETGLGGLAATSTGKALRQQVFGDLTKPCEAR